MGAQLVGEYISLLPQVCGVGGRGFNFVQGVPPRAEGVRVGGDPYQLTGARSPDQLGDAYLLWGCRYSEGAGGGRKLARGSPMLDGGWRLPGLTQDSPRSLWSSWGGRSFTLGCWDRETLLN